MIIAYGGVTLSSKLGILFTLEFDMIFGLTRVISVTGPGQLNGKHFWEVKIKNFTTSYFQVWNFDVAAWQILRNTANLRWSVQRMLAATNMYLVSAFFVKLSLFLLYLRLFNPDKITRWLVYGGITVCGLFYSANVVITTVISMPSPGHPDTSNDWISRGLQQRIPLYNLAIARGVFGTFSDIYLLVIPIRSIFQLQLSIQRKLGVSSIFLIGILWVT